MSTQTRDQKLKLLHQAFQKEREDGTAPQAREAAWENVENSPKYKEAMRQIGLSERPPVRNLGPLVNTRGD